MVKPFSLKLTLPRARLMGGVSGEIWMSLPASNTLPCTVERARLAKGSVSLNW